MSDPKNDQAPGIHRRRRWAGLALVTLVLLAVVSIGAVLSGLPAKLIRGNGAHSTAASVQRQVNIPSGFVAMSVGGPVLHIVASIRPADSADISATVDSRIFSPRNGRSVTRVIFTSVSVYKVDSASAGLPKGRWLMLSLCDAGYMQWFLNNAMAVTVTPASGRASQPDTADLCFNRWGVSNRVVDARWHFSSAPADPAATQ